jgi:hypothetical protein
VTRAQVPLFGYAYVALTLVALLLLDGGDDSRRLGATAFALAAFCFLWFVGSLRARLVRYDPDGFFASVVVLGGSAFLAVQAVGVASVAREGADDLLPFLAALASAAAATVIFASSLAALRARKVSRLFGRLGLAGGAAVFAVGLVESLGRWTLTDTLAASWLGFLVWVAVTATYLLRR